MQHRRPSMKSAEALGMLRSPCNYASQGHHLCPATRSGPVLAQAQHKPVYELRVKLLQKQGVDVKFAIHPVPRAHAGI